MDDTQAFLLLIIFLFIMFVLGFLMIAPLRRTLDPDDAEKRVTIFLILACIGWVIGIGAPAVPESTASLFVVFGPLSCVAGFTIRIRRITKKFKVYP